MLLIRCHGRCIDGKYRRGRQGLKNESLYRATEPASGHPPISSLRPRAHVRVFACRRAAVDPEAARGLRTGCDAPLQSVRPGRSACLNLHVRLPALSQPGLPRLLRRPQKEGEAPVRNPITGISGCTRRERPRRRRASEQRDELAAFHSITSSARANSEGGISRPKIRRGSIAIPGGDPSSPRLVVPASELFLLKRLARLLRGRIEVKDLVVGAGSDPGSGRHVAVAAEGDAAVVETDRQAIAARQFVDRDTAAVAIDHAVCGLFPKAIAAGRQRALVAAAL